METSRNGSRFVKFSTIRQSSEDDRDVTLIESEFQPGAEEINGSNAQLTFKFPRASNGNAQSDQNFGTFPARSEERWKKCRSKAMVVVMACIIIAVMVVVWHFYHLRNTIEVKDEYRTVAKVDVESRKMSVLDKHGKKYLSVLFDSEKQVSGTLNDLKACCSPRNGSACLGWNERNSSLTITAARFGDSDDVHKMHCVKVEWSIAGSAVPLDCIDLTTQDESDQIVWFGGHKYLLYPVRAKEQDNSSCSTECLHYVPGGFSVRNPFGETLTKSGGNVIEPLWISSLGVIIKASTHHSINVCPKLCKSQPKLCITSVPDAVHQDLHHKSGEFHLDYMICVADNLPSAFQETVEHFIKPDKGHQDVLKAFQDVVNDGAFFEDDLERQIIGDSAPNLAPNTTLADACSSLIEKPLWNIAWRGTNINAVTMTAQLRPLQQIGGTGHLADVSQVYDSLGNFRLRNDSVISMHDFVSVLHTMKWKVMLPITPFVNYDSVNFGVAAKRQFLVKDRDMTVPSLTKLRANQNVLFPGVIDLTNSNASKWLVEQVGRMKQELAIDYFHMYYGQSTWLPNHYELFKPLHNPGHFSTLFADVAFKIDRCSVSDVAYDSQMRRQFVLLSPAGTMRGTLSAALAAGLMGYPFFVASFPTPLFEAAKYMERGPLQEGLVRWIEMVSFFPVMHVPWDSDVLVQANIPFTRITAVVKKYVDIRNGFVIKSILHKAMLEAEANSSKPVVAPMWLAPDVGSTVAREVLLIEDQFMIGPDLVVAPIVNLGSVSRNIYLPPGKWRNIFKNTTVVAPSGKWLKNYQVQLEEIAVFVRAA